tara:strand:+ start:1131 stop:1541 length:411 start_codon:yes stop_codon:yes gene_type:complete
MFFKKKDKKDNENFIKIAALLIHAAKIDENYSQKEHSIIQKTLLELGVAGDDLEKIIENAQKIEEDSNQILDFTKQIKMMDNKNKIKIIETLWKIVYSNNVADNYETSLMTRLGGLLYIDNKTMGDIKERVKKEIL